MRRQLLLYLKGMAMGASDVIPGVSGGTIAFVTGIYPDLIVAIDQVSGKALSYLFRGHFKDFFRSINVGFLMPLILGIVTGVLLFARVISWVLQTYPIPLWSFFFGLVLASILSMVTSKGERWSSRMFLVLVVFSVIGYLITLSKVSQSPDNMFFYLLCGFIAAIAMILPGISGAFVLLILGVYERVLDALNRIFQFGEIMSLKGDFLLLSLLALGALIGLKIFSRVLNRLFIHNKTMLLSALIGFMIGSLNKLWPWKNVLLSDTIHGKNITLEEISVLPQDYGGDPQFWIAVSSGVLGGFVVFILKYTTRSKTDVKR